MFIYLYLNNILSSDKFHILRKKIYISLFLKIYFHGEVEGVFDSSII